MHKSAPWQLAALSLVLTFSLGLVSCGGSGGGLSSSSSGSPISAAVVPVTFSMQDNPPAGVTVLSFEIQVTSASLQPSDSSKQPVSLLVRSADIELEHLQSEPALLGSMSVPVGTYSGLSVSFANPQIAVLTSSAIPGATCTAPTATGNLVCKLTPKLNSASITVTAPTAPFPMTLAANSPLGFLLHFDVNASVQSDLSITPQIDLKQLTPQNGVVHAQHLVGTITAVAAPNFTLQPGIGGPGAGAPVVTITTDSNTSYSFANKGEEDDGLAAPPCAANGFSCLTVGQTVRVTVNVQTSGTLLATQAALFEEPDHPALHGTVTNVDAAHGQFQLTILGGEANTQTSLPTNAAIGVSVTVSVTSSTVYESDLDGITLPSGLSFKGISDLTVGQAVQIQLPASATAVLSAPNALSLTTSRVRLVETAVTGTVTATNATVTPPTFTLGSLPPVFGSGATITVQTLSSTKFCTTGQGAVTCQSGVSGLAVNDKVSAGGLLFKTATAPTLVAEGVLKR